MYEEPPGHDSAESLYIRASALFQGTYSRLSLRACADNQRTGCFTQSIRFNAFIPNLLSHPGLGPNPVSVPPMQLRRPHFARM